MCVIYVLVGCVFIGVSLANQNILFSENFSTDLSRWKIAGSPTPRIVASEGTPAPSFCTMDDLNYGGYAVSKNTFDYSSGLSISVDLKPGNASYPDQRSASFRLFKDNTLYTDGSHLRVSDYLIGVNLTADNYGSTPGWGVKTPGPWVSFFIRYIKQNGEEDIEKAEEISINSGSGWHNLRIEINEAKKVIFYLDNQRLYTSSNSLPSKYSQSLALGLGYRLCYYDNISVYSSSGNNPEEIDNDGDGYTENQGDCNDSNSTIHPGATEICGDGIDQDCNGSDLICNNNPDPYNYYLPAFTSLQNSWTGVALSNASNNLEADATVVVYNERGSQVAKVGKNLPASGKTSFLVASGLSTLGWMHVNSSQPLSGLAFFAKPPLMADIPFVSKLEKNLVVPHVAQDVNWDTTIMLCNPKDNACNINVINVNDNGGMVAQKSIALTAKGCGSYSLGNLFTAPLGGKIYLQASSDIAAFALYSDTKSGGSYYAGINAVAENYTIKKVDLDGDGYASDVDCNDNDASIHPGAYDTCGDGIDQDCNGSDSVCQVDPLDTDNDGDGFTENQGDCNDSNATIYPGAQEICGDGIIQDCNRNEDLVCDNVDLRGEWQYIYTETDCPNIEAKGTLILNGSADTITSYYYHGKDIYYCRLTDISVNDTGNFPNSLSIFPIMDNDISSCRWTENRNEIECYYPSYGGRVIFQKTSR